MSSLLIFSRPSNSALALHRQYCQPERGDVVDINASDTFFWGNAVRTMGWWQEVVCLGAGLRDLGGLLTTSTSEIDEGRLSWRHRIWRIDLDELAVGQMPGSVWVVSLERLLACAALKPQALESAEIGLPAFVIG